MSLGRILALTAAVLSSVPLLRSTADACGCLSPALPPPLNPVASYAVNQQSEQIIFESDGQYVTAHVLIRYAGDPSKFAWIVPVPSDPELSLSEPLLFSLLDRGTTPPVQVYSNNLCPAPAYRCEYLPYQSCWQNPNGPDGSWADASVSFGDGGGSVNGVTVVNRLTIGSYDTVVFTADDPMAAVNWLRMEGFIVNDTMAPYMRPYTLRGMLFVASKLLPGAGVEEIRPLQMRFRATRPMVPLQLTAIAAEPNLTVTTYILGNSYFTPVDHPLVNIPSDRLGNGSMGRVNYPMALARVIDEAGGDAFITEFAGSLPRLPNEDAFACAGPNIANDGQCQCPASPLDTVDCERLNPGIGAAVAQYRAIRARNTTLTRLTTRISPEEMLFDPSFEPTTTQPTVGPFTGVQYSLQGCEGRAIDREMLTTTNQLGACTDVYCGPGAECAITSSGAGCICPTGRVAKSFTDVDGRASLTCVPAQGRVDFAAGGVTLRNACEGVMCGTNAVCVDVGGFPTCRCATGSAAVLTNGEVRCAQVTLRTSTPGGQNFSARLRDVRVCIPPPPSCGSQGWLVPNTFNGPSGVVCADSLATAQQLTPLPTPPPLDCGTAPRTDGGMDSGRRDAGVTFRDGGVTFPDVGDAEGRPGGCACTTVPARGSRFSSAAFIALGLCEIIRRRRTQLRR